MILEMAICDIPNGFGQCDGKPNTYSIMEDQIKEIENLTFRKLFLEKELEDIRRILNCIAKPNYGLQGIVEDGGSKEEEAEYFSGLVQSQKRYAYMALQIVDAALKQP
jgi:hypothetical protein